jgi:hypothetical protein
VEINRNDKGGLQVLAIMENDSKSMGWKFPNNGGGNFLGKRRLKNLSGELN